MATRLRFVLGAAHQPLLCSAQDWGGSQPFCLGKGTLACKLTSTCTRRWVAGFAPMLAIHLAECSAVRLVDTMEKLLAATSINMLAWTVATELNVWFDWCLQEDTEARLVLLSDGEGFWKEGVCWSVSP